ncbi:MAG: tetratricopeptide repeat protein, partial [Pirellulales bacterium]
MNDARQFPSSARDDAFAPRDRSGATRLLLAIAGVAILCGAVVLVYRRALDAPLIFDDFAAVQHNRSIRQLWPLWGSDGQEGPLNPTAGTPVSARPVVNLTFAINYHLGQFSPFGYHAFNLAVHILSALLIWRIMTCTLRLDFFQGRFEGASGTLGFAVALLWALHPLTTESVEYVTQRTELMYALFYLATLAASIGYWSAQGTAQRAAWLILATSCCLAGMLSKEMMATAPAMILLCERTFVAGSFAKSLRRSWPLYVALALTWTALLGINWNGPRTPLVGYGMGVSAVAWWLTQTKVLFLYLKLAVWPWPLSIHYDMPYLETVSAAWPWLISAGLLGALLVWLVWRRSALGYAAAWVVVILSPTFAVPLLHEVAVERRMYLPLVAIVASVVVGGFALLQSLMRRSESRTRLSRAALISTMVAAAALAGVFAVLSARRLEVYRDELTLWQDTLEHQPEASLVRINLGVLLARAGQHDLAQRHFEYALQLKPDSYDAHYNLGLLFEELNPTAAIEHYRQALRLQEDHVASHNNLGRMLEALGKTDQARDHHQRALELEPDFGPAHNNLGVSLLRAGDTEQATGHLEQALRANETIEAYTTLATAYALAGRRALAIATAEKGAQLARDSGANATAEQIE